MALVNQSKASASERLSRLCPLFPECVRAHSGPWRCRATRRYHERRFRGLRKGVSSSHLQYRPKRNARRALLLFDHEDQRRVPFCWNDEEGRGKVPFQLKIAIELVPEVFDKSGKHQRQGKRCLPIGSYLPQRPSSSAKIDNRANKRPIEKAKHRVIALCDGARAG